VGAGCWPGPRVAAEPTNRQLGLGCGGIVLGAAAGMTSGFVLLFVWVQGLGLPMLSDDPKGLATIAAFVLPSIAVGAIAAPIELIRRERRGRPLRWALVVLGVIAAPSLFFWLRLLVLG